MLKLHYFYGTIKMSRHVNDELHPRELSRGALKSVDEVYILRLKNGEWWLLSNLDDYRLLEKAMDLSSAVWFAVDKQRIKP